MLPVASNVDEWLVSLLEWYMSNSGAKLTNKINSWVTIIELLNIIACLMIIVPGDDNR